jgi:hypothetical protein
MANKKFWLGMLAMALVFGLVLAGCDNGGGGGGGGGGTLTIKINTHDNDSTTYYVGPVWEVGQGGGWSASGYTPKSGTLDANEIVTVQYTSDDIPNVWGQDCYIAWHTTTDILSGTKSNKAYKMAGGTIKLDYDGSEDTSLE